jgi:hypothetical protein
MKSGFWGGGILSHGVTNKNRASNCTKDFLRKKNHTKVTIFCGEKKKS